MQGRRRCCRRLVRLYFFTKLKAHSGEPLNEIADTRAKAGRESEDETKIENMGPALGQDRLIFSWHTKTKGNRKGGWSAGVGGWRGS